MVYLYSMEFGEPPFYAELNKAIRNMDSTKLQMFGPFARALYEITWNAEAGRNDSDKIKTG